METAQKNSPRNTVTVPEYSLPKLRNSFLMQNAPHVTSPFSFTQRSSPSSTERKHHWLWEGISNTLLNSLEQHWCGIWTPGLEKQPSKWHFARITPQDIVQLVKDLVSREFYHHHFSRVPVLKGNVCSHTGQVTKCALPARCWELLEASLSGAGGSQRLRARAGCGRDQRCETRALVVPKSPFMCTFVCSVTKLELFITFMFWDVCFNRTFLPPIINVQWNIQ